MTWLTNGSLIRVHLEGANLAEQILYHLFEIFIALLEFLKEFATGFASKSELFQELLYCGLSEFETLAIEGL